MAYTYLNPLDWLMEELGSKSVRSADDIIVLAQSAEEATAAFNRIAGWMAGAGFQLHPDKVRIVDMSEPILRGAWAVWSGTSQSD